MRSLLITLIKIALTSLVFGLSMMIHAAETKKSTTGKDSEVEQLESRILVIGSLRSEYYDVLGAVDPMAKYVQDKLASTGSIKVVTVIAQDREHLAQLIRHGRVDWTSQTAYNATFFLNKANMNVLARGWRGGSPTYKSVFFVRNESLVQSLSDLNNRTIAFEHPYSTSAYYVPKLELESIYSSVKFMPDINVQIEGDSVGYTFSKSEYNTALWVQKGIVDAGVFSSYHWNDESVVPSELRDEFRVIHETGEFVRALELVRGDLDEDLKAKLSQILQEIHADPEAQSVRLAYFDTHRFDMPSEEDVQRVKSFGAVKPGEEVASIVGESTFSRKSITNETRAVSHASTTTLKLASSTPSSVSSASSRSGK